MKMNKIISAALVMAIAMTTSGCHIYKKFEMPEEGLAGEVAAAQKEAVDSTALGNVKWDAMFTDPQLQALIQIALDSNVDLENARLNVTSPMRSCLARNSTICRRSRCRPMVALLLTEARKSRATHGRIRFR